VKPEHGDIDVPHHGPYLPGLIPCTPWVKDLSVEYNRPSMQVVAVEDTHISVGKEHITNFLMSNIAVRKLLPGKVKRARMVNSHLSFHREWTGSKKDILIFAALGMLFPVAAAAWYLSHISIDVKLNVTIEFVVNMLVFDQCGNSFYHDDVIRRDYGRIWHVDSVLDYVIRITGSEEGEQGEDPWIEETLNPEDPLPDDLGPVDVAEPGIPGYWRVETWNAYTLNGHPQNWTCAGFRDLPGVLATLEAMGAEVVEQKYGSPKEVERNWGVNGRCGVTGIVKLTHYLVTWRLWVND
jgi:hypothetical protein